MHSGFLLAVLRLASLFDYSPPACSYGRAEHRHPKRNGRRNVEGDQKPGQSRAAVPAGLKRLLPDLQADSFADHGEENAHDRKLDRHEAEDNVAPDQSREQRQKDRPHDFRDGISRPDVRR